MQKKYSKAALIDIPARLLEAILDQRFIPEGPFSMIKASDNFDQASRQGNLMERAIDNDEWRSKRGPD